MVRQNQLILSSAGPAFSVWKEEEYGRDGKSFEELLKAADSATCLAKSKGKTVSHLPRRPAKGQCRCRTVQFTIDESCFERTQAA